MERLKLMVCFVYKQSRSRWFLKSHVSVDGAGVCLAFVPALRFLHFFETLH